MQYRLFVATQDINVDILLFSIVEKTPQTQKMHIWLLANLHDLYVPWHGSILGQVVHLSRVQKILELSVNPAGVKIKRFKKTK